MSHPNPPQPNARLARTLVLATFLLTLGIIVLALPTALVVFAASANLDQCANGLDANPMTCYWTTGIVGSSNSHYIEGMGVPQRELFRDMQSGNGQCDPTTHRCIFTFSVTWSDVTVHGYDFLMSWETARTVNIAKTGVSDFLLNPCANYNNDQELACTSAYTNGYYIDVVVPDDSFQSGSYQVTSTAQSRIDAFEALWGNRTVRLYANQPITAAHMILQHCDANLSTCPIADGADTSGTTVISYTLVFTTNATNALFTFAGHLAESGNPAINALTWGYENGAGATGGANWHIKDPKFNGTGGSQDNQLNLREASAFPIDSNTRANGGTLTSGVVTDTIWITNTASGASDIAGYAHWYVCMDATAPYTPASASAIPDGCPTTTSGSGYTVTDIGTKTLTIVNAGSSKNSSAVSPVFTPTFAGRYCFLTVFTPTDTIPYNYGVMSDTNGTSECFYYNNPTAVSLSSFRVDGTSDVLPLVLLGVFGVLASMGLWKFGFRR